MMRILSLNKRHEYEFTPGTTKNALVFGDLDNDGYDEFAIGNDIGEVLIFKGREVWQKFTKLGFVSCLAIGDILNEGKNCLVVVTGDGFCHIYDSCFDSDDQAIEASEELGNAGPKDKHMIHIHTQRVPANVKDILLGDIDGDGRIEMVLGLTDRVVRSYRWSTGRSPRPTRPKRRDPDRGRAKLIALNKWECAKQIGSITLHHNWEGKPCVLVAQPGGTFMRIRCHADGSPSLKDKPPAEQRSGSSSDSENAQQSTVDYQLLGLSRMRSQEIATEIIGDIRTGVPIPSSRYNTSSYGFGSRPSPSTGDSTPQGSQSKKKRRRGRKGGRSRGSTSSESVQGGSPTSTSSAISSDASVATQIDTTKLTKEIESITLAEEVLADTSVVDTSVEEALPSSMKCPDINITELESSGSKDGAAGFSRKGSDTSATSITESKSKPYAVATLDGTIMLVQDEVILWALAVDHQIFALGKMDVNNDKLDEIVACAWDGQVYFIDQHKTCVKFNFGEPVRAFACGMFSGEMEKPSAPALAFVTFKGRLYIYFDIKIKQMAVKRYDPDLTALAPLYVDEDTNLEQAKEKIQNLSPEEKQNLVSFLLYKQNP